MKGSPRGVSRNHPHNESFYTFPCGKARVEKATTKVWIVFNGTAQLNAKRLNTESLLGPKLQSDIVDVLVKFRKEPVALAGEVSLMYHQILLRPGDRPLNRFLYRNQFGHVLRGTAAVYDPLGFLSPYVIKSKLLIQKASLEARNWDELLPTSDQQEWTKCFENWMTLNL